MPVQTPTRQQKALLPPGGTSTFHSRRKAAIPWAGVSLCGNSILLGITDGYVADDHIQYIGCGVQIYMTVPAEQIETIYRNHLKLCPTELAIQPWGDLAFEVMIGSYQFMIAAVLVAGKR